MSTTTEMPKAAAAPLTLANRFGRLEPAMLVWVLLVGVLALLVLWPIGELVVTSFQKARTGVFTIQNYFDAYGRQRYVDALLNSLALGALASFISVVLAVPMAWAAARTDMPGRGFATFTVLAAFILPPYLGAVGWILLAGPNAGWINQIWSLMTGSEASVVNVYTFFGLAMVIALNAYPFIFIFVKSALDLVSSEMEDAANILGAGTWTTTIKVTLPLVWPSILAGVILVFLETIALFGTPAIIGIPARINVVTTQLWQFFEAPVRAEVAAAYAMPLLLVTAALIGVQKLMLSRKGYVAQTGKGGERRPIPLGPWRWVILGWCVAVCLLSVAAPVVALMQASFARAWGRGFSLDNLTLDNYYYLLFGHDAARTAVVNTFVFSGVAATAAVVLGLAVAYVSARRLLPFSGALGFLCMAPFVIPGIVMAIGFYAAYSGAPLMLYGTAMLMILAFTARFLPIAYANGAAGMRSIHPEMEEAVRILGGGRLNAIRSVVAPLLKKSLLGGWLLVFILATRELSAAIFLVGPNTRTISVLLYDLSEEGNLEVLSALGGILLIITLVFVGIGMRLIGRDFMLRRPAS
jgi:iron(III) transport system permease protein